MAKRRPEEIREETRKQSSLKRRDAEANRKVLIGLFAVGGLLVILLGAGLIQELVIKPGQPIAVVNDTPIPVKDYEKLVRYAWSQQQQVSDPQGASVQVLDEMIDNELLREQAQQRGIAVTQDEVSKAVEKLFGYYRETPTPRPTMTPDPSAPTPVPATEPTATPAPTATPISLESYQQSYKDFLTRLDTTSGMNDADFRSLIERDLINEKLYTEVIKDTPKTAEQVRVRHILVAIRTPVPTPEPTATGGPTAMPSPTADPAATPAPTPAPTPEPRDDAEALARITEAQQKLAAGEDFAAVAKAYSDDPGSVTGGGELGWFAQGQGLVQEFEDAAFTLEVGKLSEPVKTQFGYHLIQVEERDPARDLDPYLLQQRQYEAYQKWLTDLRSAAKIERLWSLDRVPPTPSPQ